MYSRIRLGIGIIIFLGVISFIIYQTRFITRGPRLSHLEPENGSTLSTPFVLLQGQARNVAVLSINDNRVLPHPDGSFRYPLILNDGLSFVVIRATDRFGKTKETRLSYWLEEEGVQ